MKNKKSLWPYGIILSLVLFAVFIVSVAVYISGKQVSLTHQDYYVESVEYDEIMAMKRAAQNLSEQPIIAYDSTLKMIEILFPSNQKGNITGKIEFFKPDNSNLDFTQKIDLTNRTKLVINTADMKTGIWQTKLYWSVERIDYLLESTVQLL